MAAMTDYAAVVASAPNQLKQLTAVPGTMIWGQVFADRNNTGTVWLGGSAVTADRGIPIFAGSSFFFPPTTGGVAQTTIYFFFQNSGDIVYLVGVKN
jgi:hypothetical protein